MLAPNSHSSTHSGAPISLSIAETHFTDDAVTFLTPTWEDLTTLTFQIAQEVLASHQPVDRIITLAKGGWPMTRTLVDFLRVEAVASMGVKFYAGINQRLKEPRVYQELPVSVAGERVLLFDDVADSGESLQFAVDYLQHQAGVASVRTATVFYKPHSRFRPDYFGKETSAWIVFPYELVESAALLRHRWQAQGVSDSHILARFQALGFRLDRLRAYQ